MGKFYFSQIYEKTGQDPGKYSDFLKAFRILEKKLKESFFFCLFKFLNTDSAVCWFLVLQ